MAPGGLYERSWVSQGVPRRVFWPPLVLSGSVRVIVPSTRGGPGCSRGAPGRSSEPFWVDFACPRVPSSNDFWSISLSIFLPRGVASTHNLHCIVEGFRLKVAGKTLLSTCYSLLAACYLLPAVWLATARPATCYLLLGPLLRCTCQ